MIQVYDISSFTNLNNEESISSVSNVVSDKGAKIYKQLYNAALLSVIKEKFPEITGVLIVAEGGQSISVLKRIQQATVSLLDINLNQIEILTMK
jgi:stage III sporulation protein AG